VVHPATVLDTILGIWGAFLLLMATAAAVIGCVGVIFLVSYAALRWIAWAVTSGSIARPGEGAATDSKAETEDDEWQGLKEWE
jgi:hypothetical protein